MTTAESQVTVYQLRMYLREISPLIWRRLLVRSDSTIADLHYTLQIALGWTDFHLHQFVIRGKRYGVSRLGCTGFRDDSHQVHLQDFHFRLRERFLYEYDFGDLWQHEIRVEKQLPFEERKTYPVCIGGARSAPPEDCGGAWAFMALRQHYSIGYMAERVMEMIEQEIIEDCYEELHSFRYWSNVDRFDSGSMLDIRMIPDILYSIVEYSTKACMLGKRGSPHVHESNRWRNRSQKPLWQVPQTSLPGRSACGGGKIRHPSGSSHWHEGV
ncbi:MAG TPA: plasmid pRiA4b ORF-3 family protein [Anaerolineales bacterium]